MNRWSIAATTHPGGSPRNEDHVLVGRMIKNRGSAALICDADDDFLVAHGLVLAVADGIGGLPAGHEAGRLCLWTTDRTFYADRDSATPESLRDALTRAVYLANAALLDAAAQRVEPESMGCTLAGVLFAQNAFFTFHAGDCRVYRCRGGFLKPLTRDDTVVQAYADAGGFGPEDAAAAAGRHTVTGYVGRDPFHLHVARGPDLRPGDRLLVSSDGLHDVLSIEDMERTLQEHPHEEMAVEALVAAALAHGGEDNISVVLAGLHEAATGKEGP